MIDACDPNADIDNLRKLIKLNTGSDFKLTRNEICQAYNEIQDGKLPLPPLVMSSDRTYLVDKKSPLKANDYEQLFDSTTKRTDLKRIARKVDLKNVEQMTKTQIVDAIGKRLRYMKIHEPVKIGRKRRVSVSKNTAVNNTAVNNVNFSNNSARNNSNFNIGTPNLTNNNGNKSNFGGNNIGNGNGNGNGNSNWNRNNGNNVSPKKVNRTSTVTFPKGGLFIKGEKPKFLGGARRAVKPPTNKPKSGLFSGIFGKKKNTYRNNSSGGYVEPVKRNNVRPTPAVQPGKPGIFSGIFGKKKSTTNTGGGVVKPLKSNVVEPTPRPTPSQPTPQPTPNQPTPRPTPNQPTPRPTPSQPTPRPTPSQPTPGPAPVNENEIRRRKIQQKKEQFKQILQGYQLSNANKDALVSKVTETTNANSMRKMASDLVTQRKRDKKEATAKNLLSFLTPLEMPQTNKNAIMRKFKNTNTNVETLKREALNIQKRRKNAVIGEKQKEYRKFLNTLKNLTNEDKRALESNGTFNQNKAVTLAKKRAENRKAGQRNSFVSFLNQLDLENQDKNAMMTAYNSNSFTMNALKKKASNLKTKRVTEKKVANKNTLKEILVSATNLSDGTKRGIIKRFDRGEANLNTLREEITKLIQRAKDNKLTNKKQKFAAYVKSTSLSNANKNAFIQRLSNTDLNFNALKSEVNSMVQQAISDRRAQDREALEQYMNSKEMTNQNKNSILSKFDANSRLSANLLKRDVNTILKKRAKEQIGADIANLEAYAKNIGLNSGSIKTLKRKVGQQSLNSLKEEANALLQRLKNTKKQKNKEDLTKYMKSIGLSENNQRNILNRNLPINESRQMANDILRTKIAEKRNKNRNALSTALNNLNLNNTEKNQFLKLFNNNPKANISEIQKRASMLIKQKKKTGNRADLEQYFNNIGLDAQDRKVILKKFDKANTNLATLKNEANQLKKSRESAKLATNRKGLEKYMVKTLKLSKTNANSILAKFNAGESNILTLKTNAEALAATRRDETKNVNRQELLAYFNEIGLSQENGQAVLNKFNGNSIPLKKAKQEAKAIINSKISGKRAENRQALVEFMDSLQNINAANKKIILKEFDKETANLNALKNKASQLNAAARNKGEQRRELKNYINGLGINATPFLAKFNKGKGTLNSLKAEANKAKGGANAKGVAMKKKELSAFMKNKQISKANKAAFLNRVQLNTNLNALKNEITELNRGSREKQNAINAKKTELKTFLNTLTSISIKNKKMLLDRVVNNATNINALKNEASRLNKNAGNAKTEQNQLKNQQQLEKHLKGLKDLTANRVDYYKNQLVQNRSALQNLLVQSKQENQKQKSEKTAFYNYIKATKLPKDRKADYIKRVKAPRSDIVEIKKLVNANVNAINQEAVRNAEKKNANNKIKEEEAKKKLEQNLQTLSSELQKLTNLTPENRTKFTNSLKARPTTLNQVVKQAKDKDAGIKRLKAQAEENRKKKEESNRKKKENARKARNTQTKDLAESLQSLTTLTRENRKKFMSRLPQNNPQMILANAVALNDQRKKAKKNEENALATEKRKKKEAQNAKKSKEQNMKNVSKELQKLTNLTKNNRAMYIKKLETMGKNTVIKEAQSEDARRKREKEKTKLAQEEEIKKRQQEKENAKKKANEERKSRNTQTKNVATKLQGLTSLKRENRQEFMKRLPTNGPEKVIANAQALNKQRKNKVEAEKRLIENKKKADEAKKQAEQAKKTATNLQTKRVAGKLQALKYLKRENRKKFMNKLPQNGADKVIANATKLDKERMEDEASTRRGIEWKLKKIGVSGKDLQGLLRRWNTSKNKTIFNNARKMVASKRDPLLARIKRDVPASNNYSQAQQKWTAAIKAAPDDAAVQKIERLLDAKLKLKARTEAEVKSLPPREQTRYLKNFMTYKNDVAQRTQELNKLVKTKRNSKDKGTKELATKLQSMNKLERRNRQQFMSRVAKGEDSRVVLRNADKLQRNRTAKQKLEAERKQKEQQEKERKELEQKKAQQEKEKQAKLRSNTAKMLQGMSKLDRKNRLEFMKRLNKGNDPARVIANARKRDADKKAAASKPAPKPQPPQGRVAPKTKKMKAKNRARKPSAKPSYGSKKGKKKRR